MNDRVDEDDLGLVDGIPILKIAGLILARMFNAMKLVSDDYEEEDPTDGLDLNARFADAYYAARDLFEEVGLSK